jgi:hypothetical protein
MPAQGEFKVRAGPADMYDVTIRYRWHEGLCRMVATEVSVQGLADSAVTGDILRRIPVERLLRAHLPRTVRSAGLHGRDEEDAGLPWVAAVYRVAFVTLDPPVKAVAEQLGVSASVAANRVMAARRAGYLPPTKPGKAGA